MIALMVCKRPRKSATGERGQALLELLPVVSVLLVLIFGVIECSYAIWQLEVITALTREGSNLASRNEPLSTAASVVITDGTTPLNLATNGEVIVTAVQNQSGNLSGPFLITDQALSGSLTASSRIGIGKGATATLPPGTTIPLMDSIYVTEVFISYTPITPLGGFLKITMPSTLYDVAYF